MKAKLPLFIFIDALGWEIVQQHPSFLQSLTPVRQELQTIFGYSSACDPSIISGLLPSQHGLWSSFYYSPQTCPYGWVRHLRFLPSVVTDYHRVRHKLSQGIKKIHGFTGYFQIYNVPFQYLPLFDYAEKDRIWGAEGLPRGETVFSLLTKEERPFYVDDVTHDDGKKIEDLKGRVEREEIEFAYLLLGGLDGTMHGVGTQHPKVGELLSWYERKLSELVAVAEQHYGEVPIYVFADHGMHNVTKGVDLQADVEALGLQFGVDYAAVYDSTMARFWFFHEEAKSKITRLLSSLDQVGRMVADQELSQWGVYFPDHQYGESIFLLHSGLVIAPCFMGRKAIPGMHGYDPSDRDSSAAILSNRPLPQGLESIEQIFWLMLKEMELAPPQEKVFPYGNWVRPPLFSEEELGLRGGKEEVGSPSLTVP